MATSDAEIRQQERYAAAARARDRMMYLLLGGVVAMVVGITVAVAEQPSSAVNAFGGVDHSGSDGGYGFGLVLAGVGSSVFTVALIAYGVCLGIRAARI